MPGTPDALLAGVAALPDAVTSWSATGIGRTALPVAFTALGKGGHVRVGMEDTLTLAKGSRSATTKSWYAGRRSWPNSLNVPR